MLNQLLAISVRANEELNNEQKGQQWCESENDVEMRRDMLGRHLDWWVSSVGAKGRVVAVRRLVHYWQCNPVARVEPLSAVQRRSTPRRALYSSSTQDGILGDKGTGSGRGAPSTTRRMRVLKRMLDTATVSGIFMLGVYTYSLYSRPLAAESPSGGSSPPGHNVIYDAQT